MNEKIRPIHLERAAYVYIRQSSLHQVLNHVEGRRRQYELKARAQELGFTQVEVRGGPHPLDRKTQKLS